MDLTELTLDFIFQRKKKSWPYNGYARGHSPLSWQWGLRSEDSFLKPDHCREKTSSYPQQRSSRLEAWQQWKWKRQLTCGCSCFREDGADPRWSQKPFSEGLRGPGSAGLESSHLTYAGLADTASSHPTLYITTKYKQWIEKYGWVKCIQSVLPSPETEIKPAGPSCRQRRYILLLQQIPPPFFFRCFTSQRLKSSRGISNELAAFVLVICAPGRARK